MLSTRDSEDLSSLWLWYKLLSTLSVDPPPGCSDLVVSMTSIMAYGRADRGRLRETIWKCNVHVVNVLPLYGRNTVLVGMLSFVPRGLCVLTV